MNQRQVHIEFLIRDPRFTGPSKLLPNSCSTSRQAQYDNQTDCASVTATGLPWRHLGIYSPYRHPLREKSEHADATTRDASSELAAFASSCHAAVPDTLALIETDCGSSCASTVTFGYKSGEGSTLCAGIPSSERIRSARLQGPLQLCFSTIQQLEWSL